MKNFIPENKYWLMITLPVNISKAEKAQVQAAFVMSMVKSGVSNYLLTTKRTEGHEE